jgi:hypothetical protein
MYTINNSNYLYTIIHHDNNNKHHFGNIAAVKRTFTWMTQTVLDLNHFIQMTHLMSHCFQVTFFIGVSYTYMTTQQERELQ